MRKTLSPKNVTRKRGTGLLISAYFVLGIALVPTKTLFPEMGAVQDVTFNECHKSCHKVNDIEYCTHVCSNTSKPVTTTTPVSKAVIDGSTGPTHRPKPVGTQGH